MRKLSLKSIVAFRSKSPKGKKKFVDSLKLPIKPKIVTEGGGDYWITSLTAIVNSFKANKADSITNKIEKLQEKIRGAKSSQVRSMYQRNIDILNSFSLYDLNKLRPGEDIEFLNKKSASSILKIKDFEIES